MPRASRGYRRGRAAPHRLQALLRCRHEQRAGARSHPQAAAFRSACSASNMAGCSPPAMKASGCSRCSANRCENAVALGCTMLMSAPGPVSGPITDAIEYLKRAGDIAAEYGLQLAIEFNSQHPVLNKLAVLTELIYRRRQAELRLPDRHLSLHAQRRRRPRFRERAGGANLLLPVQRSVAQSGHRRGAADRSAAARQRHRQMARNARAAGGKEIHRLSELRGAESRTVGALAL